MGRDGDLESVFFFRKSLFPLFYLLYEKTGHQNEASLNAPHLTTYGRDFELHKYITKCDNDY